MSVRDVNVSMTKAQEYMNTVRVKKLVSSESTEINLHYNILPNTPLKLENVLSICLYCDWTGLSTALSSTFRKSHPFESLQSVKERNSEFAVWSKTLRETIEYYGQKGWDYDKDKKWNNDNDRVQGPFFCGMSSLLAIPEFNIRLCGPTSTSHYMEVAIRFAGEQGCILELDTNGYFQSEEIRSFNCSWISTYNGEAEHLFIGGFHQIKLNSVRFIKTAENFGGIFEPLYYFDCMLNGIRIGSKRAENITKQFVEILFKLIEAKLNNLTQNKLSKYIMNAVIAYCNHKI